MAERRTEHEPRPMGELLHQLVLGRGWNERMALGRLQQGWPAIVGDAIAARSTPIALERGVLTIRAEAGAWASELTLLAPRLRTSADTFLGAGSVGEVRVITGARTPRGVGPPAPTTNTSKPMVKPSGRRRKKGPS